MSDVKISGLPSSTGVTPASDYIPIVHNGTTEKITPDQLISGIGLATDSELAAGLGLKTNITDLAAITGAALIGFRQSSIGATVRTVDAKLKEEISVLDFGAVGDGVTDDTAAFNLFWQTIKASKVQIGPDSYVTIAGLIPKGTYYIGSSINWTNLNAYNLEISAYGAVLLGNVAGGNVIDMIGVLGSHIKGLTIVGGTSNTPKTAVLVGPIGTATCGINSFVDCKFIGYYTLTSFWNIGSETTEYTGCRFSNSYIGASSYSYIGDGVNRFGAASSYQTIRSPNVSVSFTANSFKQCSFRNWSTVNTGASVYLEYTNTWSFDKACYFLAFTNANLIIRLGTDSVTLGLSLKGLFESSLLTGLDYCVKFLVPTGESATCYDNDFDFTYPTPKTSVIKLEDIVGGTPGTLVFTGTVRIVNSSLGAITLFDAETMTYLGDLHCKAATTINIQNLSAFKGIIYTDTKTSIQGPTAGNNDSNIIIIDKNSGNLSFISNNPVFHCMSNAETSGSLVLSRALGQADRSSNISVSNSSTTANNNIQLQVHTGTVGNRYNTLTAKGDGHVYIGDIANSNIFNFQPDLTGSGSPALIVSGTATNSGLSFATKGSGDSFFSSGQGLYPSFLIQGVASSVNYIKATPSVSGAAASFECLSSVDANIDLQLIPKGTGNIKFGAYTATPGATTGYITIKDSAGNLRKLAVIA